VCIGGALHKGISYLGKHRAIITREPWDKVRSIIEANPRAGAATLPVPRDGSTFHPGLQRGSGFTIGPKGEGLQIADSAGL
jgi:hypothetical protein